MAPMSEFARRVGAEPGPSPGYALPMESEGTPSPTEIDLVAQALSGTLPAFEALMARYQKAVFNIAVWKSRNFFDAEDLTQDIFLAAFKALPTLKDRESFGAWLFGIAYNRCHKWFQRERNKIVKIQVIKEKVARRE